MNFLLESSNVKNHVEYFFCQRVMSTLDVFPNEIVVAFMEFLPIKALTIFSLTCSRIHSLAKEMLCRPEKMEIKERLIMLKLTDPRIWANKRWMNVRKLASFYLNFFGAFNDTGFELQEFIKEHTSRFISKKLKNGKVLVWNLRLFGIPDKYF